MALPRESHQLIKGCENPFNDPVCGFKVIPSYEFPNVVEIDYGFRMEIVAEPLTKVGTTAGIASGTLLGAPNPRSSHGSGQSPRRQGWASFCHP